MILKQAYVRRGSYWASLNNSSHSWFYQCWILHIRSQYTNACLMFLSRSLPAMFVLFFSGCCFIIFIVLDKDISPKYCLLLFILHFYMLTSLPLLPFPFTFTSFYLFFVYCAPMTTLLESALPQSSDHLSFIISIREHSFGHYKMFRYWLLLVWICWQTCLFSCTILSLIGSSSSNFNGTNLVIFF